VPAQPFETKYLDGLLRKVAGQGREQIFPSLSVETPRLDHIWCSGEITPLSTHTHARIWRTTPPPPLSHKLGVRERNEDTPLAGRLGLEAARKLQSRPQRWRDASRRPSRWFRRCCTAAAGPASGMSPPTGETCSKVRLSTADVVKWGPACLAGNVTQTSRYRSC